MATAVSIALQLHKAIVTSKAVKKEIDWFQLNRPVPRNFSCAPDPIVSNAYKSYIHNNAYNSVLQTFDMFPDKLARLRGKRDIYLATTCVTFQSLIP